MKESNEFSLSTKTKYELIKYIIKIEKTVNRAIKKLDNVSSPDVRNAIKILRCEDVRINDKDSR